MNLSRRQQTISITKNPREEVRGVFYIKRFLFFPNHLGAFVFGGNGVFIEVNRPNPAGKSGRFQCVRGKARAGTRLATYTPHSVRFRLMRV